MKNKTILITGITGFLGSHLGEYLSTQNFEIVGLKRTNSNLWRCDKFLDKVSWIDCDTLDWKEKVINLNPNTVIHTAWSGVASTIRSDLKYQIENINFLTELLTLMQEIKPEKFIAFGSQAEYGKLNSIAFEDQKIFPETAYGISKVLASQLTEYFCIANKINWYWLRIFSVFGEKESEDWFLPSIITKIIKNQPEIELSSCDQKYAYLYIKDFVQIVSSFVLDCPKSGIYNISGIEALSLKTIISMIKNYLDNDVVRFNFGAIKKREDQSMLIMGSMKKYIEEFGVLEIQKFDVSLKNTIDYYKYKRK